MAKKTNPMPWIIALGAICLIGVLVHSSLQQTQKKYEVCMAFKGATHCATATGATLAEATRSAQTIDCQLLTTGRDENMVCLDSAFASSREVK